MNTFFHPSLVVGADGLPLTTLIGDRDELGLLSHGPMSLVQLSVVVVRDTS